MKVDGNLFHLIQGISQQPASIRNMGQCQLQENCSSNVMTQLSRRQPTDFIANLPSLPNASGTFYGFFCQGQYYFLVMTPGQMFVYDTHGTQYDVTVSDTAKIYFLNATKPTLSFTTINDVTYIANSAITVQMLDSVQTYVAPGCLLSLIGGNYGRTYTVTVSWGPSNANSSTFSYTTPDGSSSTQTPDVATTYIATQLASAFNSNGTLTAVFSITQAADVLWIQSTDSSSANFTVSADDGDGGAILFVNNNSVTNVGDLSRFAPQGYMTEIVSTNSVASYYLQFIVTPNPTPFTLGTGFGQAGIWKETSAGGIPYLMDVTTMPMLLTLSDGIFTCDVGVWKGRQVGDVLTNPAPTFVGNTIRSMSNMQGRLVFYSGQNLIMSRTTETGTDNIQDFWIETATAQTDTDSIDIQSTTKNTNLIYGIPFNRDLITFGEVAQFHTIGSQPITPTSASLVLTTEYTFNENVKPVLTGRNIFYALNYGSFTGIREFYNDPILDTDNSRPVTQHCLQYLKGSCTLLTSSTTFDLLLVHTDNDPTRIFAYEFYWEGQNKSQSSWSTWIFRDPVLYSYIINDKVFIFCQNTVTNQIYMEAIDLDNQPTLTLDYGVQLDGRIIVNGATTAIANPWNVTTNPNDQLIFVQADGCPHPGLEAEVDSITSNTITFHRNMNGGTIVGGHAYKSRYQPTLPYIKDRDHEAVGTGILVVREFRVNYVDTGFFGYTVSGPYIETATGTFEGRIINDPDNVLGIQPIVSGMYQIPYREDVSKTVLEINSSSHLPFTITNIEWKGQYIKKGTRMPDYQGLGLPGRY
ncbi:MAG TPA: hypothetical protein VNZ45_16795 [Bacteroidia bacterium]|jgi:hypothetical protein|nr:hypothetical protein [Bacteroidia bacterium]